VSKDNVAIVELQIGAREHGKGEYKSEENHEEANVCPDGADEINQAHDAHGNEEERCMCVSHL
jgi:hypothetical protein